MVKGIFIAARGLENRTKNIDVVANNLANLSTTGFKREVPFIEILNQEGQISIQQLKDFSPGELVSTSNTLDLALTGKGFFMVQTENGSQLTRNGNFQISSDGFLVDQSGNKVLGTKGEINFGEMAFQKEQTIAISNTGEIRFGDQEVDQLKIVRMNDVQNAERAGNANFITDEENISVMEDNEFQVHQGYLEESNTNPILEMEAMINLNKDYESSQRIITYLDQSLSRTTEIGRV